MSVQPFTLGRLVITPNALEQLAPADVQRGLQRHQAGDWGEMSEHDWEENETARRTGLRLFSIYRTTTKVTFWIITEADRSATTLLMPNDY